jgi:DNA-binding MarR family transcriptional regulator
MGSNGSRLTRRARESRPQGDLTAALDAIRRIVQALRVSSRRVEQELGVSGAQLFVLHALSEAPADSLNELAARTFTHQSSVSVVVQRLVRKRFVTRTRSSDDRRRVTLTVTPAGRALLRNAPAVAQLRLVRGLRQMPPSQRQALTVSLDRLVRGLGELPSRPALLFEDGDTTSRRTRKRARRPVRA